MKFYLLFFTLIILALGCSLSALSQVISQKQIDSITNPPLNDIKDLLFEKNIIELGVLKENQDPVEVVFTFTNNTSNPIMIFNVVSTCGCMNVKFDKTPIKSGSSSNIIVYYNPKNQSGNINKSIYLYTNSSKNLASKRLSIIGYVDNSMNKWNGYKCMMGEEIRSRSNIIVFNRLMRGDRRVDRIEFVNVSKRDIELNVSPLGLPDYISFTTEPTIIQPQSVGEMVIIFDSLKYPMSMASKSELVLELQGITGNNLQRSITIKIDLLN